jgi:threonine aldolase
MTDLIDLRSDTVTKPSDPMRQAIMAALVGDDVYGEDPTVNQLQETVAALLGKEDALFTPTGVLANQLAIKCHTNPGDEVIVERSSHILNYETAAPSMISSVQLIPVQGHLGTIRADQLESLIRPSVYYMPHTALVCLENTHNMAGGTIYPIDEMQRVSAFCGKNGLKLHLDGARLWNASVATGIGLKEYGSLVDSVSVCFSKGLGAPVGSAIVGTRDFIARARKFRKIFGGGMRQVGILAAAALFAVEKNIPRLKEDHDKAAYLAREVAAAGKVDVDMNSVQTNIVIIGLSGSGKTVPEVLELLKKEGVLLGPAGPGSIRAVTHMDVSKEQVKRAASIMKTVLA